MFNVEEFDINLPNRNDEIYNTIEKCPEYKFTNYIALEMAIRTREFIDIYNKFKSSKEDIDSFFLNHRLHLKKLGLSITILQYLNENGSLHDYIFNDTQEYARYIMPIDSMLADLENGYIKLIKYCLSKNMVYVLKKPYITRLIDRATRKKGFYKRYGLSKEDYMNVTNINAEEINMNRSDYYFYQAKSKFLEKATRIEDRMIAFSKQIPIAELPHDFLNTINQEDLLIKMTDFIDFDTHLSLTFNKSNVVDIPINLNLPENELIAFIKHVKYEYDSKNIAHTDSLVYIINESDADHKLDNLTRKKWADTFFIYDLYSKLDKTEEKNIADKIFDIQIELSNHHGIKVNKLDKELRQSRNKGDNSIKKFVSSKKRNEHNNYIEYISDVTIKKRLKIMKKLIDNLGYKKLIVK